MLACEHRRGQTISTRGQSRDLAGIQGMLGMLLSPWGESFPITCSVELHDGAKMHALCERIVGLVTIRRPESSVEVDDP